MTVRGKSLFPGLVPQIMKRFKNHKLFSDVVLKDFQEEEMAGKKVISFEISCKIIY